MIDTHAHLDMDAYKQDRREVIDRAFASGLEHIVTIGIDLQSSREAVRLAWAHPNIHAVVGFHPHDASGCHEQEMDAICRMLDDPAVVAVGEVGLDFYKEYSPRDEQVRCFRRFLHVAHEAGLPVVIHDRQAHREILEILDEEGLAPYRGVFHCFSGDLSVAERAMELGFHLSFTGTITFRNAKKEPEVVRAVPWERLMAETDCPFLTPVPFRGKRNEPAHVRYVIERMAQIKEVSFEEADWRTDQTARELFELGRGDPGTLAYRAGNALYLNVTNRCPNRCGFCSRTNDDLTLWGYDLRLDREPTWRELARSVGDPASLDEVVFCGYGEPLVRLEVVLRVCSWLRSRRTRRIRINTNGLANLIHGRDVTPELSGMVDAVSVSLNAPDGDTYDRLCPGDYAGRAFDAVKEFIRLAAGHVPEVVASVVDVEGLDLEACRKVAGELGVPLNVRGYRERA